MGHANVCFYTQYYVADPPEFNQSSHIADIQEGSSLRLNLTARGRPGDIAYHWSRESPTDGAASQTRGPLLDISRATRTDAGWYRLVASNDLGNASVRVRVNVQCEYDADIHLYIGMVIHIL